MQPVSNTKNPFSQTVLKAFMISGLEEVPSDLIFKDQSKKTPSFYVISLRISATVLLADRFNDLIAFVFLLFFVMINFIGDAHCLSNVDCSSKLTLKACPCSLSPLGRIFTELSFLPF
jgi:hypothetical protein